MISKPPNILVIRSNKSELKRVEEFVKEIFRIYNFPEKCLNKVLLCISEATINSIVHGNKGDHRKKVELSVDCNTNMISVVITDEGDGFDHKNLEDPTSKENILKESGRGIHIIKSLARTVEFIGNGNKLKFQIECN